MSLPQRTLHRLPSIKHGLLSGLTTNQIGNKLGVTEKTIDRDIQIFIRSGEFESWLKEEWLRLHNMVLHEDPVEAYRNITKLVSRMLTQKMEKKIEKTTVDVNITALLAEYEQLFNPTESNQTPTTTSNNSAE